MSKFATSAALSMTAALGLSPLLSTAQAEGYYGYGHEYECVGEVRSVAASSGSLLQPGTVGEIKCKMHYCPDGNSGASIDNRNGYGDTLECETRDQTLIDLATQALVNEQEIKLIATHSHLEGYNCKKVKIFPNSPDHDCDP